MSWMALHSLYAPSTGDCGDATLLKQNEILARLIEIQDSTNFANDLLTADQVRQGNTIIYYLKGSNKTVELHRQVQTGDPCEGDVSLIG